MTDFLTRLVARTLGLVPTAQPVIAPMFAPAPPVPIHSAGEPVWSDDSLVGYNRAYPEEGDSRMEHGIPGQEDRPFLPWADTPPLGAPSRDELSAPPRPSLPEGPTLRSVSSGRPRPDPLGVVKVAAAAAVDVPGSPGVLSATEPPAYGNQDSPGVPTPAGLPARNERHALEVSITTEPRARSIILSTDHGPVGAADGRAPWSEAARSSGPLPGVSFRVSDGPMREESSTGTPLRGLELKAVSDPNSIPRTSPATHPELPISQAEHNPPSLTRPESAASKSLSSRTPPNGLVAKPAGLSQPQTATRSTPQSTISTVVRRHVPASQATREPVHPTPLERPGTMPIRLTPTSRPRSHATATLSAHREGPQDRRYSIRSNKSWIAADAQPSTPTIQVSIGRIEVRAVSSPTSPSHSQRPPLPVMGLSEYLRRRARGGDQ